MCDRCPIGGQYPTYGWPGTRRHDLAPGDYGPPPDLDWPDYGEAPTGGVFGIGAR